jgi:hypothetical protein
MRSFRRSICLVSFALTLALASQVEAAWLKVAWDPPSDTLTAGYTVFYGTTPGAYTSQVNAGMVTEYTVEGLVEGTTYYFAIQAYGSNGEFSALSANTEGTTPAKKGGTKGKGGTTRSKPGKGKPSANIVDDSSIEIEWLSETGDVASDSSPAMAAQSATAGVTSYRVEVGVLPGETSYSAVTGALAARFDMADLPADTYFIRVRSIVGANYGPPSEEVSVWPGLPVPPGPPANPGSATVACVAAPNAPRQLRANAKGAAVGLNWQRGSGEAPTGFFLQVGTMPGLQNILTAQFEGNARGVTALAANAAYALRLSAVNNCGASLWAPETMLYVGVEPLPGMPQGLSQTVSDGLVTLTWAPPVTGGAVTRYLIEATTPGGPFAYDTGTTVTAFSNANTPPGQYLVTVRAGNATGFGVASTPVVVVVP